MTHQRVGVLEFVCHLRYCDHEVTARESFAHAAHAGMGNERIGVPQDRNLRNPWMNLEVFRNVTKFLAIDAPDLKYDMPIVEMTEGFYASAVERDAIGHDRAKRDQQKFFVSLRWIP